MKIQIKNRFDGSVIFETDAETIGGAVAAAIVAKADLSWADLSGADLSWADLSGANLSWANLSWADLSGADLSWADLSGANLSGANLSGANLSGANLSEIKIEKEWLDKLLPTRTILPDGDLIGWKKLSDGSICKLKIPSAAKRIGGMVGRKCRAEYAIVLGGKGDSKRGGTYAKGKTVLPDKFDPNPLVECSHGIHFFITKAEAEAYEQ